VIAILRKQQDSPRYQTRRIRKLAGNGIRASERERRSFRAHSLEPDFWPGIASEYPGVIRFQWNSPTSMESTDKDHRVKSEFAPVVLARKALVRCNVGRMVNPTRLQP